jgi:amidohydrolase
MGEIAVDQGPVLAGMEHFKIVVKGCGGHTAMPHSAVDPIIAASSIVQTVQTIQTREMDALKEPTVIMFGTINGGTVSNVIPDEVTLTGTMRYLHGGDHNGKDNPKHRLKRIVAGICEAHRAEFELTFECGHPTLVNNAEMVALVRATAAQEISPAPEIGSFIALIGEDFSEFAARVPSAFYFIGAGNRAKNAIFPHHHPKFNIDEDALALGVEMHVKGAMKFFSDFGKLTFMNQI